MNGFAERRWTSRDGLTLFARDYAAASGPPRLPVICLHGLTRNSKDFEDLAPFLANGGRRVLVPDVRGRGMSDNDPNSRNYAPPVYARDVLRLMDLLGIARAVFVGTSMGGIITMILAGIARKRIAAAVLNDVGPEVAPEGLERIKSYAGKPVSIRDWDEAVAYVRRINAVGFPAFSDEDWRRLARRTFREQADGTPALDYDPAIAAPLAAGNIKAGSLLAWLLFRRLARARPTLVIRGGNSDILSSKTATKMQARAPRTVLVEVPGVGHAPTLDEPEARNAIEQFLESVP
ncbi:MAG TPA: alpha/beta hydrolase [Sphingomicrobium sp.]|nr:alpha/beta hydrolase [Sphingomicrobium sp.]